MAITPPEEARSYNAEDLRRVQLKQLHDKIAKQKPEIKARAVRALARYIRAERELGELKIQLQRQFSIAAGDALAALRQDAVVLESSDGNLIEPEDNWSKAAEPKRKVDGKPWDVAHSATPSVDPPAPVSADKAQGSRKAESGKSRSRAAQA